MDAHLAVGVLQLGGVSEHVLQLVVAGVLHDVFQLGDVFVAVDKVHFGRLAFLVLDVVREPPVGDILLQFVDGGEIDFLHASHIGNGRLGGHGAISDDVGHFFLAVFIGNPVQHTASACVVEVHVDIGQRDTVGIEETLEQ